MEMLLSVDMYCMLLQWEKRGIGIKRGYNGIYYKKIGQQIPSKVRRLGQLKCQQSRAPGLGLACPKMWKAQIVKPHIPILGGKIQLLVGSKYLQSQWFWSNTELGRWCWPGFSIISLSMGSSHPKIQLRHTETSSFSAGCNGCTARKLAL